ncbi:MAG: hypothetical protein ACXWL2_05240 [Candidatus Chromulinivorax sp.]
MFKTSIITLLFYYSLTLLTLSNQQTIQTNPNINLIMSYEEYHEFMAPYISENVNEIWQLLHTKGLLYYHLSKENQHLFYFGGNHSCDPANIQFKHLKKYWQKFLEKTQGQNCIVLVESVLRHCYTTEWDAITKGCAEAGLITFLAHQQKIKIACPEPSNNYIKEQLLKNFSEIEITYQHFAGICQQYHRHKKINPNLNFENFYTKYKTGISLAEIEKMHRTLFQTIFNIEDEQFFIELCRPGKKTTCHINVIARSINELRDKIIVQKIAELIKEGKNIFIVYGTSHAIMQRKAIEYIWSNHSITNK